jgi:hypothetical protein
MVKKSNRQVRYALYSAISDFLQWQCGIVRGAATDARGSCIPAPSTKNFAVRQDVLLR